MGEQIPDGEHVHHLACSEVTFVDAKGNTGICRVNSLILSEDGSLTAEHLGRCQQSAQAMMVAKLGGGDGIKILDVVILSISFIGVMTSEKFNVGLTRQNVGNDNDSTGTETPTDG